MSDEQTIRQLGENAANAAKEYAANIATLQAELDAARAENEWQPIETAPKDGTPILLAAHGNVSVGWWEDGEPTFKWRFVDDFDLTPTGCCDQESDDRVPCNGMYAEAPTHWKPLPTPPKIDALTTEAG